MDGNGTTRVELGDGAWIEIRTTTNVGDLEHTELKRLERDGKTTPMLTLLDTLERVIVAWSYEGDVTPEAIRTQLRPEALLSVNDALSTTRPNKSASSSNGGGRRGRRTAS